MKHDMFLIFCLKSQQHRDLKRPRLFVLLSIIKMFFSELAYYFFLIFCIKLGNYRCYKVIGPDFSQIWAKITLKLKYFLFFEKFVNFFLKAMQNESSFDSWRSIANPMSGKSLVLELLPKMFVANQIAGFFKV